MPPIIDRFDEISSRYRAIFCDLWGCVHNGRAPFAEAVAALQTYRRNGGLVLYLTNSPRPKAKVISLLDSIGVPRDTYDEIATSGDSARAALASGSFGTKIHHIGPDRDLPFFEPTPFLSGLADIERVSFDQAQSIVCTGLFGDFDDAPENYRALLLEAKIRKLPFLCANPDIVVDYGDRRMYCAGALAAAFTEIGGQSHYFGKPHPPIYDLARNRLTALTGQVIDDKEILCIGDGIVTDVPGALAEELDCLFVSGGLAAIETGTTRQPDPAKLAAFLDAAQLSPTATIGYFR